MKQICAFKQEYISEHIFKKYQSYIATRGESGIVDIQFIKPSMLMLFWMSWIAICHEVFG